MSLKEAFEATKLTRELANSSKTLIEWREQPCLFKRYPHFLFSYLLDAKDPFDQFLLSLRCITHTSMMGSKPYHKLNVPSAGNLHPVEIYLQLRKIPGKLSGIYHLDVEKNQLVLIGEIEKDGVEHFFDYTLRQEGIFIFFSSVYFRSSWKYNMRAWRYLLLDMGHQIGALKHLSAYHDKNLTFLQSSKHKAVEKYLGLMQGEQLLAAAALVSPLKREVTPPRQNCMQVQATDYFFPNAKLEEILKDFTPYHDKNISDTSLPYHDRKTLSLLIQKRRSARKFTANPIDTSTLELFLHRLSRVENSLDWHFALLKSKNQPLGIYHQETLLKEGSFVHEVSDLLLSQAIANTSAGVLFLSDSFISSQTFYDAGILAHELYLFCTEHNIGCSGVGAYFDDDTKTFLQTENDIIYCFCIGENEGA